MKFIATLSISASVLIANASPVDQRSSGTRIALNKRDKFVSPGGDVDHTLLQKHVAYAVG